MVRPSLDPKPGFMGFAVDIVALGQDLLGDRFPSFSAPYLCFIRLSSLEQLTASCNKHLSVSFYFCSLFLMSAHVGYRIYGDQATNECNFVLFFSTTRFHVARNDSNFVHISVCVVLVNVAC